MKMEHFSCFTKLSGAIDFCISSLANFLITFYYRIFLFIDRNTTIIIFDAIDEVLLISRYHFKLTIFMNVLRH